MKKFFTFVIICIVVATVGFTTYYLMTEQQTIRILQTVYELNVGDCPELLVEYENVKIANPISVESLNPEVAEYLTTGAISAKSGGRAVLKVTSPLSSFKTTYIQVTVGDGSSELTPLYISSKEEFMSIGVDSNKPLTACYLVTVGQLDFKDETWTAIGGTEGFSGKIDFNDCVVKNIKSTTSNGANLGIFTKLNVGSSVKNLNIENFELSGSFTTGVGAVAGENYGSISKVMANNVKAKNSSSDTSACVGGLVGANYGSIERSSVEGSKIEGGAYAGGIAGKQIVGQGQATIERCRANADVIARTAVGGVVGYNAGATILYSYSEKVGDFGTINSSNGSSRIGGIVGSNVASNGYPSVMIDCYTTAEISGAGTKGGIIGYNTNLDESNKDFNYVFGCYFSSELSGVTKAVGSGNLSENAVAKSVNREDLTKQSTYFSYKATSGEDINWNFGKIWVLDESLGNYPVLDYDGAYVALALEGIYKEGEINTVADLISIGTSKESLSKNYIIKADLDLGGIANWNPIGSETEPFTGTITAGLKSDGTRYVIKNLTINSTTEGGKYQGLFAYVASGAKITNLTLVDTVISKGANVGAIAGYNAGNITNCVVRGTQDKVIGCSSTNIDVNIGGIAGVNSGTITNSQTLEQTIEAGNNTGSQNYRQLSAGAIAGENLGDISECYSNAKLTVWKGASGNVGGIAGSNQKLVTNCYFIGEVVSSLKANNVSTGGLVGNNQASGKITYSFTDGSVTGYYAGGIAGTTSGTIEECYAVGDVNGHYIGGLVSRITSGTISNCYSMLTLKGDDKDAVKTGFAYEVGYNSEADCGRIVKCFASNTFAGDGESWYETASFVRDPESKFIWKTNRVAGYITDSIYNRDSGSAKEMKQTSLFGNGGKPISVSDSEARNHTTDDQFDKCEFSSTIWAFNSGSYPTLRRVVKR